MPPPAHADVSGNWVGAEELRDIGCLHALQWLVLSSSSALYLGVATDLVHISRLTLLSYLDLSDPEDSYLGYAHKIVSHVSQLPLLRELCLEGVTFARHFHDLVPLALLTALSRLSLAGSAIWRHDFQDLAMLSTLRRLNILGSATLGESLDALSHLTVLTHTWI